MKTFKIYLSVILLVITASSSFSQDEIYNEKTEEEVVMDSSEIQLISVNKLDSLPIDSVASNEVEEELLDDYYTEDDYYDEAYNENQENEIIVYTEDDVEEESPRQRNNEGIRIITEVVVEVLFNVILAFAWGH